MAKRVAYLALLLAALCSAGCYHRVVASKGMGGMGTTVQEPYRSNTAADRAIDNISGSSSPPPSTGIGNSHVVTPSGNGITVRP
jgi:hypothetical protein